MMRALSVAWVIARHDVIRELKRPVAAGAVLLFGGCALVILRLALAGSKGAASTSVIAGALWIVLLFAALLGTSRVWSAERAQGSFEGLLLAPVSRSVIHLGKVISALLITLALHALLLVLYVAAFSGPPTTFAVFQLLAGILLADLGFAAVGVLIAGLGLRARGGDLLGPALFLPLSIPLIIAAVTVSLIAYGASDSSVNELLLFLLAYDLTFIAAGLVAFPELVLE